MSLRYAVEERFSGYPLKDLLRAHFRMSGTFIRRLRYTENLRINNCISRSDQKLQTGDIVDIDLYIPGQKGNVSARSSDLDILYEDEHIICLNKPAGICTHPVRFYIDCTLANHLMYYFNSKNQSMKIRPVSRLDKNTSGLITFAKNEYAQDILSKSNMDKEYLAITHGVFTEKRGIISEPIGKNNGVREICVDGRSATTLYEVIRESEDFTLLKINILTGRTHQIRIHLSYIGHPLAGDDLYSGRDESDLFSRQALHSLKMTCIHPVYKYMLSVSAPIPDDFYSILKRCGLL